MSGFAVSDVQFCKYYRRDVWKSPTRRTIGANKRQKRVVEAKEVVGTKCSSDDVLTDTSNSEYPQNTLDKRPAPASANNMYPGIRCVYHTRKLDTRQDQKKINRALIPTELEEHI